MLLWLGGPTRFIQICTDGTTGGTTVFTHPGFSDSTSRPVIFGHLQVMSLGRLGGMPQPFIDDVAGECFLQLGSAGRAKIDKRLRPRLLTSRFDNPFQRRGKIRIGVATKGDLLWPLFRSSSSHDETRLSVERRYRIICLSPPPVFDLT